MFRAPSFGWALPVHPRNLCVVLNVRIDYVVLQRTVCCGNIMNFVLLILAAAVGARFPGAIHHIYCIIAEFCRAGAGNDATARLLAATAVGAPPSLCSTQNSKFFWLATPKLGFLMQPLWYLYGIQYAGSLRSVQNFVFSSPARCQAYLR